jgi:hypothetical protein
MAKDSKTTFDHQPSFEQARRRALARLGSEMELRWSPARSRDELHRKFGDGSVDSTGRSEAARRETPGRVDRRRT